MRTPTPTAKDSKLPTIKLETNEEKEEDKT